MAKRLVLTTALATAVVVLATSPALARGYSPPPPATLSVSLVSPTAGALFEAPASVTITGTASITGGTSHRKPAPKLTSLEVAVDGGAATPIGNADIDPDLPRVSPATVSFSTSVAGLDVGNHKLCVTARGTPSPATSCVSVEVVEDLVDCATSACVLSAADGDVSTATFKGTGLTKVVGLRAGEWGPTDCGGLNCITGYDALWADDGGSGLAELKVTATRTGADAQNTPAIFIDGVLVTAKCGGKNSPVPCQTIKQFAGGCIEYLVRFASDPGIRFR